MMVSQIVIDAKRILFSIHANEFCIFIRCPIIAVPEIMRDIYKLCVIFRVSYRMKSDFFCGMGGAIFAYSNATSVKFCLHSNAARTSVNSFPKG